MKITQTGFPSGQFIAEEEPKKQIYIHHTAGNADPFGVFTFWASNRERIATCVTIGGKPKTGSNWQDGEVVQGFSSKYWAYHLGLKESTFHNFNLPYKSLDKNSIGIEICNWGQLTLKNGKFYSWANKEVPADEVIELENEHRGFKYYHNYTDAQIDAVKDLLLLWKQRYNIPIEYHADIWDVTPRALRGEAGVFTHNSVRYDKVDVYPHPKLVSMLKSL